MDSEWVGRAGILAQAASFFFIAPEILGPERLRGAEEAMEVLVERLMRRAGINWRALILAYGDWSTWHLRAVWPLILVIMLASLGWTVAYLVSDALGGFQWLVLLVGAHASFAVLLISVALVNAYRAKRGIRAERGNGLAPGALLPIYAFTWWVFPMVEVAVVIFFVWVVLTLARRLPARSGRLRAAVFITGATLFLGGLGTQFYATF